MNVPRKILCLSIVAASVLLLFGCKKQPDAAVVDPLAGFVVDGAVSGGEPMTEANARTLAISQSETETVLSFDFISGSRISGGASETNVNHLPPYSITLLPEPYRLIVRIEGLTYWDFLRDLELSGQTQIVGCFQYEALNPEGNAEAVVICFQLSDPCAFTAAENGSELTITLRSQQTQPEESAQQDVEDVTGGMQYYVAANAYDDYCDGTLTQQLSMTPVLCKNLSDVMLISAPFDTEAQANALMGELMALQNVVPSAWRVVRLGKNELPAYTSEWAQFASQNTEVLRRDGIAATANIFIQDGLLLCMTPERDGYLFSKRISGASLGEGSYSYEQIYIMSASGGSKQLLDFEFDTLERASYSPDGRKLAVLARTAENAHLYIFDMDNKEMLTDLTDMGFGDMVSTFAWDNTGSAIYAISGSEGMQVNQYDFSVPDENKRHSLADKKNADESTLAYCDGEVYFVESDMDSGAVIYRIKPDGGVRKSFRSGAAFSISPNYQYMAISVTSSDYSGKSTGSKFELYDLQNGTSAVITSNFDVYNFLWSWDGSKVYYLENRLSGVGGEGLTSGDDQVTDDGSAVDAGDADAADTADAAAEETDPFPYTLWEYDVASSSSRAVCDLPVTAIAVTNKPDTVYMCYSDVETSGEVIRATYAINVN